MKKIQYKIKKRPKKYSMRLIRTKKFRVEDGNTIEKLQN
jgi:hypothetical protein